MPKTIKEMAEKKFPIKSLEERHAGDYCRQLFTMGANAVLEEIESIIVNNEDNTLCMARCLVDKIKELKSE